MVKNLKGAKWSKTLKSWHIPCDSLLYKSFKKNLPENCQLTEVGNKPPGFIVTLGGQLQKVKNIPANRNLKRHAGVSIDNAEALKSMIKTLALKRYSENTIKTYTNEFSMFLKSINRVPVDSIAADHIQRYILYCINTLQLSENTIHSRMNALKFYFEQVLHREKMFFDIPRPKKHLLLPKVLSEAELSRLFNSLTNLKHKAILFTAYSAGLRVSEVVALKLNDIDSDRMQLLIENAKGKKDRYVSLSILLLDVLRAYIKTCKPRPSVYLFEGQNKGVPYTTRSAQLIFQSAKNKAGIKKDVGIHCLRHSFATHLLEKGVDIKFIKDLLSHFNIKTTERYLHVAKEKLVTITSPLDDLYKKGSIEW
jgi:site-specific recombinase XerD